MNPETASDITQGVTSPLETATLATVLFVAVELIKGGFKLEGQVGRVRLIALILAILLSFGDALFSKPTIPPFTLYLAYNCVLRGLILCGTAFGINAARNVPGGSSLEGTPLASVGQAVDAAQAAAGKVDAALSDAEKAAQTAGRVVQDVLKNPGAALQNAVAGQVVGGLIAGASGAAGSPADGEEGDAADSSPFPVAEQKTATAALVAAYSMTAAEAFTLVTTKPGQARAMLAAAQDTAQFVPQ